jgi:outer membrane autotransporter protein
VTLDAGAGSSRIRSPQAALYGSRASGRWEFKGVLGYGAHDIQSKRNVTIGAATTVATGDHRGTEWSAYGEAAYTIPMGGYELKPLAGLRYLRLKEKGYSETGSAANLTVDARTTDSVTTLLGVRYVRGFNEKRGTLEARALWGHEFGDRDPALTGRLAAATTGGAFTVRGVPLKRDSLTLGLGAANEVRKNVSLFADFNLELRGGGQSAYALLAGLRAVW